MTLGDAILAAFHALPAGGGYRFEPGPRSLLDPTNPRDPHHDGVTHPRSVDGQVVLRASPDGATYCCGLTLQLWWDAVESLGGRVPVDLPGARALVDAWFCPTMGHPGMVEALVRRGWGDPVAPGEARPGDLIQFWRCTDLARPSGHSAVFLALSGSRLRYASSQPATGGVGVHEERVGEGWTLHVVRPRELPPMLTST